MDITQFLEQRWRQHADAPSVVAESLETGYGLLRAATFDDDRFRDFGRLAEHTLLGHLGDRPSFDAWVRRLEALPEVANAASDIMARLRFARDLAFERTPAGHELPDDIMYPATSNAALALSHLGMQDAASAVLERFTTALAHATKARAKIIANATNSITFHLQQGPRHITSGDLMVDAAIVSRRAWEAAGSWKEVERGEYFVSLACVLAGRATQGLQHAELCRAICVENGSDPYELFFAEEAIAKSHLALNAMDHALRALDQMSGLLPAISGPQNLKYCRTKLDETRALIERPVVSST